MHQTAHAPTPSKRSFEYWKRTLWGDRQRQGEPPLVRQGLPFLGCAPSFAEDAGAFLAACRRRHGDVFTVFMAGRRVTFVTDPFSYPNVLKLQRELAFHPIAHDLSAKAFGHSTAWETAVDHERLNGFYHAHLKGEALETLGERMQERLEVYLAGLGDRAGGRTEGLYEFVSRAMFFAGMETLFGAGTTSDAVRERFRRFDDRFALLAAGLPGRLVGVLEDRRHLAALFDEERADASEFMRRRDAYLRAVVSPEDRRYLQFSMIWAAQANTMPAAFWTLAQLLAHPAALAAITEEARAVMAESGGRLGQEALRRMTRLQSATSEALRLCAGSMTIRRVERDLALPLDGGREVALRAGDQVAIYPYLTHRDPELYPEPERYRYDRFLAEDGGVKQFFKGGRRVTIPLMPYGGGVSMCPGRFLANAEILQMVALVVTRFEMELVEAALPPLDQRRAGLGILPPRRDVRFRFRPRLAA